MKNSSWLKCLEKTCYQITNVGWKVFFDNDTDSAESDTRSYKSEYEYRC